MSVRFGFGDRWGMDVVCWKWRLQKVREKKVSDNTLVNF